MSATINVLFFARKGVPASLPQKITSALTVRAVAIIHPHKQHQLFARLLAGFAALQLSCLLLWLRHSSRQLMCPAQRVVGRHTYNSFQQSAHPGKKSRQPLLGACLFPGHMLSLQSLPHSSHRTHSFLIRAPCSHPTSCSRSHFGEAPSFALAARNPTKAIALLAYKLSLITNN